MTFTDEEMKLINLSIGTLTRYLESDPPATRKAAFAGIHSVLRNLNHSAAEPADLPVLDLAIGLQKELVSMALTMAGEPTMKTELDNLAALITRIQDEAKISGVTLPKQDYSRYTSQ